MKKDSKKKDAMEETYEPRPTKAIKKAKPTPRPDIKMVKPRKSSNRGSTSARQSGTVSAAAAATPSAGPRPRLQGAGTTLHPAPTPAPAPAHEPIGPAAAHEEPRPLLQGAGMNLHPAQALAPAHEPIHWEAGEVDHQYLGYLFRASQLSFLRDWPQRHERNDIPQSDDNDPLTTWEAMTWTQREPWMAEARARITQAEDMAWDAAVGWVEAEERQTFFVDALADNMIRTAENEALEEGFDFDAYYAE